MRGSAYPQRAPDTRSLFDAMLTEQIQIEPHWASLSGTVLEGGYEFEQLLEAEQDHARYKVHVLGGGGMDAFVDIFRADGRGAEQQLAAWNMARSLEQTNLATPLIAGKMQVEGVDLIYVVLRRPDEALDTALSARPLAPDEAGEVLVSVSRALQLLHSNDLVHGCVSPEQILASGNSIQLSTVCVRKKGLAPEFEPVKPKYLAPESNGPNVTPAADVWCLGATLLESLTQKEVAAGWREQAAALPVPFSRIVERCLEADPESRCDLSELLALYQRKQMPAPEAPRPAVPAPQPAPVPPIRSEIRSEVRPPIQQQSRVQPDVPPRVQATSAVQRVLESPRIAQRLRAQPKQAFQTSRAWIVLAAILLAVILWAIGAKRSSVSKPAPPNTAASANNNTWPTRTLTPEGAPAKSQPPPAAARVDTVPSKAARISRDAQASTKGPVWRVVLYTYSHPDLAEKQMHLINTRHPELGAQVFSPNGQAGPYLVVAGGRMDRDQAASLRQKALRLGLPRDSYIQNYQQ